MHENLFFVNVVFTNWNVGNSAWARCWFCHFIFSSSFFILVALLQLNSFFTHAPYEHWTKQDWQKILCKQLPDVSSEKSGQFVSPSQVFDDSMTAPSSHFHSFVNVAAEKYLIIIWFGLECSLTQDFYLEISQRGSEEQWRVLWWTITFKQPNIILSDITGYYTYNWSAFYEFFLFFLLFHWAIIKTKTFKYFWRESHELWAEVRHVRMGSK